MHKLSLLSLLALGAACAAPAFADDVQALAQAKHCYACHDDRVDKVGPSFRNISRRFRGLNNAKEMLVRIVQNGTDSPSVVYHWGPSKMPPGVVRVPVNEDEAGKLVDYILSLK